MKSQANFSEERVDAFLEPLEANHSELRKRANYERVEEAYDKIDEVEDKLDQMIVLLNDSLSDNSDNIE
jgi:hypothetical protein